MRTTPVGVAPGPPPLPDKDNPITSHRRSSAAVTLLVSVTVLTGCSYKGAETSGQFDSPERGYPDAPAQHVPVAFQDVDVTITPVALLPDPEWVGATADQAGVPARAVAAYAGAAIRVGTTTPDCGIGWNTLAGIGEVESMHGAYDESGIDEHGHVHPPIIGVALDGGDDVMEIPDTDGGALDGDDEWDRAVGPMQFIPETWGWVGRDGNMDGEADPHHIDDAALAAAELLCHSSGETVTDDGWNNAVTAYNRSVPYAREVAAYASRYAAGSS